jgi:anti-sigma B factor antagonist
MADPRDQHAGFGRAWSRIDPMHDCVVVTTAGEIDFETAYLLDRATRESARFSPHLIVDMTRVTFVDSSGLGVLIGARRRATERGGSVRLVHPPDLVRRLLITTQLQQTFAVFETLDEAVAALRASS